MKNSLIKICSFWRVIFFVYNRLIIKVHEILVIVWYVKNHYMIAIRDTKWTSMKIIILKIIEFSPIFTQEILDCNRFFDYIDILLKWKLKFPLPRWENVMNYYITLQRKLGGGILKSPCMSVCLWTWFY